MTAGRPLGYADRRLRPRHRLAAAGVVVSLFIASITAAAWVRSDTHEDFLTYAPSPNLSFAVELPHRAVQWNLTHVDRGGSQQSGYYAGNPSAPLPADMRWGAGYARGRVFTPSNSGYVPATIWVWAVDDVLILGVALGVALVSLWRLLRRAR